MDQYGMTYVFRLEIEGRRAVEAARQIRTELQQELGQITVGGAAGTARTTSAVTAVGDAVETTGKKATEAKTRWQAFREVVTEETRNIWALRRVGYGIESLGRSITRQGLATGVAIALMTRRYIEFDDASTLAAQAMRINSDLMGELREEILETSVEVGRFDPEEVAAGLRIWAAGTGEVVQSSAQLNRLMGDTINIQKLAALNNESLAQTMENVGGIMGEYNLTTQDVAHITEVLNYVAASTFATVGDMGQAFKFVGPIANELGITFEETAVALGLMSDRNIRATMAGRAFRQMLTRMMDPTEEFNEAMNDLLRVNTEVGESWRDIMFLKGGTEFIGFAESIEELAKATANLTLEQRSQRLAMLATANEIPALIALVNEEIRANEHGAHALQGFHDVMMGIFSEEALAYQDYIEDITELPFSLENAHLVMTGQWERYTQSEAYQMQRLERRWTSMTIKMGDQLADEVIPVMQDVLDQMEKWVEVLGEHPGWTKGLLNFTALTIAIGAATSAVGFLIRTITNLQVLLKALGTGVFGGGLAALILKLLVSPKPAGEDIWTRVKRETAGVQQEFLRLFGRAPNQIDAFIAKNEEALKLLHEQTDAEDEYLVTAEQVEKVLTAIRDRIYEASTIEFPTGAEMGEQWKRARRAVERIGIEGYPPLPEEEERFTQEQRDAQIEALYEFYRRANEIREDAAERAKDIISAYNDWEESADAELRRRLISLREDFVRARDRRVEDYETRRGDIIRDAQKQEERDAQRHYDELRRLEQDHADRMIDLLEARDVMGIVKEIRRYRRDRERTQQNYKQQRRERQDDAQQRLDDMERDRRREEEQREEDYERRRQEFIEAHEREREERKAAMNEQLIDLQESTKEQLQELTDSFMLQLAELREERGVLAEVYGLMYDDVEQFWQQNLAGWSDMRSGVISEIEGLKEYIEASVPWFEAAAEKLYFPLAPRSRVVEEGKIYLPIVSTLPSAGGGPAAPPPAVPQDGEIDWDEWKRQRRQEARATPYIGPGTSLEERVEQWRDWAGLRGTTAGGNMQSIVIAPTFQGMGVQDREWFDMALRQQVPMIIKEMVRESRRSY